MGSGLIDMPVQYEAAIAALHGKQFTGNTILGNEARPRPFLTYKVFWDPQVKEWTAQTYEYGTAFVNSYSGEWYRPLTPLANISETDEPNINKSNTRILIRLRYGGSIYVEKILREEIAISLSERLKAIRNEGSTIPLCIRIKVTGVLQELIDFAQAPVEGA